MATHAIDRPTDQLPFSLYCLNGFGLVATGLTNSEYAASLQFTAGNSFNKNLIIMGVI